MIELLRYTHNGLDSAWSLYWECPHKRSYVVVGDDFSFLLHSDNYGTWTDADESFYTVSQPDAGIRTLVSMPDKYAYLWDDPQKLLDEEVVRCMVDCTACD